MVDFGRNDGHTDWADASNDVFMDDAPDEFLDPILCDVMTDQHDYLVNHIMDK